jgi:hypothetical protein
VGDRVRVTVQPEESRLAADKKTDAKAYDEYLRGRYLWGQRTDFLREDPQFQGLLRDAGVPR